MFQSLKTISWMIIQFFEQKVVHNTTEFLFCCLIAVREMHELQTSSLEGIKVQTNEADVTDIQAIIEGPGKNCWLL